MSTRVVFLGTPAFAVPSLDALARLAARGEIELAGVVTQPDRRGDRGRVAVPAVKERASALGLPVWQPEKLSRDAIATVLTARPEALVWAAYGNLIPRALIDAVRGRAVNVTLMEGTADLDAGPILAQERTAIGDDENAGVLTTRLASLGAAILEQELPRYLRGELRGKPQDEAGVAWAAKLARDDAALDFERPADELARVVRAATPEPGAFTTVHGKRLGVTRASVAGGRRTDHGTLELRAGVPHIASGAGWLRLDEVRPAGKRAMTGAEWARGLRNLDGSRVPS